MHCWLDNLGFKRGRARAFTLSKIFPDCLWDLLRFLLNMYQAFCPRAKRPEREADHSSPSGTDLGNERSCTSIPPMRLFLLVEEQFYPLPFLI